MKTAFLRTVQHFLLVHAILIMQYMNELLTWPCMAGNADERFGRSWTSE
jgi:hypothetical protein